MNFVVTVKTVNVDPYLFIILVDTYPFLLPTKMIKGYGSTKTSLMVDAVYVIVKLQLHKTSTAISKQT